MSAEQKQSAGFGKDIPIFPVRDAAASMSPTLRTENVRRMGQPVRFGIFGGVA
jgi:hypothetical protein